MKTIAKQIQWNATKSERAIIQKILDRAEKLGVKKHDRINLMMDIEAAHCNGCPMDLERLLSFPDFDFSHDIAGISRHIDRTTGELLNCFLPRSAKP